MNSTVVVSLKNNLLFVNGDYLCAFDISNDNLNQKWCTSSKLSVDYTSPGVTPAIDENNVYIYNNGKIVGYDQLDGKETKEYGSNVNNICNLGKYGCTTSQPIITQWNIIWNDGTNVTIFDKNSQSEIITFENLCGTDSIGSSIAAYNNCIFVSCKSYIIAITDIK